MKKSLLVIAILTMAVTTTTYAQTSKGTWLLGGGGSFSSSKNGDFKWTQFSLSPDVGYFIMDNLGIGAAVSFSSYKEDGEDASSTVSFGPFVRYYFLPLGPKAKLFANGSFGFGSQKFTDSESFTTWSLAAGPAIFLNPSVALEFTVGYNSVKFKDADDPTNTFGVNIGFQIHLKK